MKQLLLAVLILFAVQGIAQETETEKAVVELDSQFKAYQDSCMNDSILLIHYQYTGKEDRTVRFDTVNLIKYIHYQPTEVRQWKKETPSWEGFKQYLERKEEK